MNKEEKARFLKLRDHLFHMDPWKFDFATLQKQTSCGTVGCATGEFPKIWPEIFEYRNKENEYWEIGKIGEAELCDGGDLVEFLGMPREHRDIFYPGFQKEVHKELPLCGYSATPIEVAAMMDKYLELFPANENADLHKEKAS